MATFCERAAHSVDLFYLCILTIGNLVIFSFSFEGLILVLISPVPGHCIHVTFRNWQKKRRVYVKHVMFSTF